MTTAGLHPFVNEMQILDDALFFPRSLKTIDSSFGMISGNIYTGILHDDNYVYLSKISQFPHHTQYFSEAPATDGIDEYEYHPFDITYLDQTSELAPQVQVKIYNNHIYVLSYALSAAAAHDYPATLTTGVVSTTGTMKIEQFSIDEPNIDKEWEVVGLDHDREHFADLSQETPVLWNTGQYGMFISNITLYHYIYTNTNPNTLKITSYATLDGAMDLEWTITNIGPTFVHSDHVGYDFVTVEKPSPNDKDIYIVTKGSNGLRISYSKLIDDGGDILISGIIQTITSDLNVSIPASYSFMTTDFGVGTNVLIYNITGDANNNLYLTDSTVATNETFFLKPVTYALDKTLRFKEPHSFSHITRYASVRNPDNRNIIYVAYVTAIEKSIRVVKFYRHKQNNENVHLIMWATRVGAFSPQVESDSVNIILDNTGKLIVRANDYQTGDMLIWTIYEFPIDLGHSISDVVADVDIIPNMLEAIYDLIDGVSTALIPSHIVITSITIVDNEIEIIFKYILFEDLNVELIDDIKALIIEAFDELYTGSTVSILDLTEIELEGEEVVQNEILVKIPVSSIVKPCVVKGTEVVTVINGVNKLVLIETIKPGDYVINQKNKRVKVLDHTIDTIYTNNWTAPYIIPVNYFGCEQPYKPLLISGDHGILHKRRKLYPYKMGFRQLPYSVIEYHHLLLENDDDNYYIANGLFVESYHRGAYLT